MGTGNVLILGGLPVSGWQLDSGVLTPKDAWSIDKKYDDGMPSTGNIIAVWGAAQNTCTTAASNLILTGTYYLTSTSPQCALVFLLN
jgi:hypothetical protein